MTRLILVILLALQWHFPQAFAQTLEIFELDYNILDTRLGKYAKKNRERMTRLEELFQDAGCTSPHLQKQPIRGSELANVICALPGSTDSLIIVGAHYDFAGDGQGVVDNWSGASLLPSLYESLRTHPRHHTYLFIGFGEEETGFLGSQSYVRQLSKEQRLKIHAMVNLDSLGLSGTKVEMGRGDQNLIKLLSRVSKATGLPLDGMNADRVGDSDANSFSRAKVPTVTIHSITQDTLPIIHSRLDLLTAVKLNDYHDTFMLVAYYLAALDELVHTK